MRVPIVFGNWKMNLDRTAISSLAKEIVTGLHHDCTVVDVGICPPFPYLERTAAILEGSNVYLGAQNGHWAESGAYTGEVSMSMLVDAGCRFVIIGHSERRQYFGETDEIVSRKINSALNAGLRVILCVGETEEQRDQGITKKIIAGQLTGALAGKAESDMPDMVIAYEPIWAIGTGRTATTDQAQEVHAFIREWLSKEFGTTTAESVRIQYGGSVKPNNMAALISMPDIDGALVGGASLKSDSFLEIVSHAADGK